jgi:hypothetical protein
MVKLCEIDAARFGVRCAACRMATCRVTCHNDFTGNCQTPFFVAVNLRTAHTAY